MKWDDGTDDWHYQGHNGDYELKLVQEKRRKKLPELLFKEKECVDAKIICEGKTFECHKSVLACRSDVFAAMFLNKPMTEANSGKVEIDDFGVDVIETMIYFIYNDEIQDKKKITANLLRAADKYIIVDLVEFCLEHFMSTSFSLDR